MNKKTNPYKKVDPSLDFAGREAETVAFWKENRIFEKSIELREGKEEFTFYDGRLNTKQK